MHMYLVRRRCPGNRKCNHRILDRFITVEISKEPELTPSVRIERARRPPRTQDSISTAG